MYALGLVIALQQIPAVGFVYDLKIDDSSGGPPLHEVRHVTTDAASGIYVLQSTSPHLLHFDKNGSYVGTIGGEGSGPGEFQTPFRMGWRADTLWVADQATSRVSLFVTGTHSRDFTFRTSSQSSWYGPLTPAGLLSGNAAFSIASAPSAFIADGRVSTLPLLAVSEAGEQLAEIGQLTVDGVVVEVSADEGNTTWYVKPPFSQGSLWSVAPDGSYLAVLDRPYATNGDPHFTVHTIRPDGDTLWTRTFRRQRQQARSDAYDQFAADMASRLAMGFHTAASAERAIRRFIPVPPHLPSAKEIVVGSDAVVIDLGEDDSDKRWILLLDPADGSAAGIGVLPSAGVLLHADSSGVYILERDDLEVEFVVRYEYRFR